MMSTSVDELLEIHSRFPVLALLLSLSNPSTISATLSSPPLKPRAIRSRRSEGLKLFLSQQLHIPVWVHDVVLHILAAGVAGLVVFIVVQLGYRGVVINACSKWFDPLIWVCIGAVVHTMRIATWRMCLGPIDPELPYRASRWRWSMATSATNLQIIYPRMARFLVFFFQFFSIMNYGFGTVMLSSTTLVTITNALFVFWQLGLCGLAGRCLAIWYVLLI